MTAMPPRVERNAYGDAFFLRPRDPDDHEDFEWLLPRMTPLFVYADENGRDWVRWAMPPKVAKKMFGNKRPQCACCDERVEMALDDSVHLDTALDEVNWWFDA